MSNNEDGLKDVKYSSGRLCFLGNVIQSIYLDSPTKITTWTIISADRKKVQTIHLPTFSGIRYADSEVRVEDSLVK